MRTQSDPIPLGTSLRSAAFGVGGCCARTSLVRLRPTTCLRRLASLAASALRAAASRRPSGAHAAPHAFPGTPSLPAEPRLPSPCRRKSSTADLLASSPLGLRPRGSCLDAMVCPYRSITSGHSQPRPHTREAIAYWPCLLCSGGQAGPEATPGLLFRLPFRCSPRGRSAGSPPSYHYGAPFSAPCSAPSTQGPMLLGARPPRFVGPTAVGIHSPLCTTSRRPPFVGRLASSASLHLPPRQH